MGRPPTNRDRTLNFLARHGSGSFILDQAVSGARSPSKVGNYHVKVAVYDLAVDGHLEMRPGGERFKPQRKLIEAGRAAREAFAPDTPPDVVGKFVSKRLGPVARRKKQKLLLDNYRKQQMIREKDVKIAALAAANTALHRPSFRPTSGHSGEVHEDIENSETMTDASFDDVEHFEGLSDDNPVFPPQTPLRAHPTLADLTPPNTTSPLARRFSQACFRATAVAGDHDLPNGCENVNVGDPAKIRATSERLQDANTRLEATSAELSKANVNLTLAQEREEHLQARLDTEVVSRMGAEKARDEYRMKHCGAEAALKGSQKHIEKVEKDVEVLKRGLVTDMYSRFSQLTSNLW